MRCNIARSIAGGGGNVVVGSYTGNGGTQTVTFESEPKGLIINNVGSSVLIAQGETQTSNGTTTLNGKILTVTMSGFNGWNSSGTKYNYILFM